MAILYEHERRQKPRIYVPFPAIVQARSENGKPFHISTVIDNFSAGGLYLRIAEQVKEREQFSVVTQLSVGVDRKVKSARVMLIGEVTRVEHLPGGVYGVAVEIKKHKFL
jgi:hypothetical protein